MSLSRKVWHWTKSQRFTLGWSTWLQKIIVFLEELTRSLPLEETTVFFSAKNQLNQSNQIVFSSMPNLNSAPSNWCYAFHVVCLKTGPLLELISLTLVCGLVDPSLFTFLLKLLQWGLASIYQGKLESPLIKVTLRMTFLSRQSSCVVIVPSQLANHAWLRIIVPTYWVSTLGLSTQLQNQFLP